MGQEIDGGRFQKHDFERYARRLREETELLRTWLREGRFSQRHGVGGYELEAWLVDARNLPAPVNEAFLARLSDSLVSPELSLFNIELNSTPQLVAGDALRVMHRELETNWARCREVAQSLGVDVVTIGILPTVDEAMLSLSNMSRMRRYRALNEQVLRLRRGKPLTLDIQGAEHLRTEHADVMLEAATTSFQLHLQVSEKKAADYFNASLLLSAPMVAASCNSPLLFGRHLWQETRIPLFEQAVAVGGFEGAAFGPVRRVTFGTGYVRHSLLDLFLENLEHYPVLLPASIEAPPERLAHLKLHNGTIWRWNRPLVDFDSDGTPHLRIEHRVIPSGPSLVDGIANAAFFFGLVYDVAEHGAPADRLDFVDVRENFYAAAKHGLEASVRWLDGSHGPVRVLLSEVLLPRARRGLRTLGCDSADVDTYLGIIADRVRTGRTGSAWQLAWCEAYGRDMAGLVGAYRERQAGGAPVHEWEV